MQPRMGFRTIIFCVFIMTSLWGMDIAEADGTPKLLLVIINGGVRTKAYFNNLYASLSSHLSYPIMPYSDAHNFNHSRGDVHQPFFPPNFADNCGVSKLRAKVRPHAAPTLTISYPLKGFMINIIWYNLIPLLLEMEEYDTFLVMENDAIVCSFYHLEESFRYFANSREIALSYWDSCPKNKKIVVTLKEYGNLELHHMSQCGMVAAIFKKEALRRMHEKLGRNLFRATIEASYVGGYAVRRGVVIHGGAISTSGLVGNSLTCDMEEFQWWNKTNVVDI